MNRRRFLALTSVTAVALPLVKLRGATAPSDGSWSRHRIVAFETKSVPLP